MNQVLFESGGDEVSLQVEVIELRSQCNHCNKVIAQDLPKAGVSSIACSAS